MYWAGAFLCNLIVLSEGFYLLAHEVFSFVLVAPDVANGFGSEAGCLH